MALTHPGARDSPDTPPNETDRPREQADRDFMAVRMHRDLSVWLCVKLY